MFTKTFTNILFASMILGCASSPPKISLQKIGPVLVEPDNAASADLNFLISQKTTGRVLLGLPPAKNLTEDDLSELKAYFHKKGEGNKSAARGSGREVLGALKSVNLKALETTGLDQILRASEHLNEAQTAKVVKAINAPGACVPAQVSLAFASQSEKDFPAAVAKEKTVELYLKAYSCGSGETKARAAYRLALFAVAEGQCEKSLTYWPSVVSTNEVKFLFSRAQYWKNFCESEKADRKQLALSLYQSYPLSYHAIRELQDENEDIGPVIGGRATPRALVRTGKDDKLNQLLMQVEAAIENQDLLKARKYLAWIPEETWQNVEPHFLLYVAHLASLTKFGLVTFQTLARALSQNPSLKNTATMKLFYPKWYFSEIETEAQKNGLDPYLVMSLVRQESAFDRGAVSGVGARGLMQLMPGTARNMQRGMTKKDLLDPEKNLRVGTIFLSHLLKRYDGNVVLALAAYNAGPGVVDKWIVRYKVSNPVLFKDLIPYRETREYVASILRNMYWYQIIENQGKTDTPILTQKESVKLSEAK